MLEGGKKTVSVLKVIEGIKFSEPELLELEKYIRIMRIDMIRKTAAEKTPGTLSVS